MQTFDEVYIKQIRETSRRTEETGAVVIGAGHAGCEAALALARRGIETVLFTVSVDSIALMPCNPNSGGTSKGHLVREVDALGGEMAKVIDRTFVQSRMLNRSKGPAVHSLRAQADKKAYSAEMRRVLENTPHLAICQAEVSEVLIREILRQESFFRRSVIGIDPDVALTDEIHAATGIPSSENDLAFIECFCLHTNLQFVQIHIHRQMTAYC